MSSFGAASSARKALLRASNRRSATLVAHSMPSDSKLMTVRTRFAPSPTGCLHIGGLRTALFCWLYARRHAGEFVLRIEDTDLERSTNEAIQQILDGMEWAGLDHDEGPFYQTKRFDRYKDVIEELLATGNAYRCYCTKDELEQLRIEQIARGEKPRYDGRWRDRTDSRPGVSPVVRFKNPLAGAVVVDVILQHSAGPMLRMLGIAMRFTPKATMGFSECEKFAIQTHSCLGSIL